MNNSDRRPPAKLDRPGINPWALAGASLVALAGAAAFNAYEGRKAEAEHPPTGKFKKVNGVRLHYQDKGTGAAVVLLHGNGVSLLDWEASGVSQLLSDAFRVVSFDRPGFGFSARPRSTVWTPAAQAELILAALAELGINEAVFVAHSWATLVALAIALDHPSMVSGLVLISGYYYGTGRPDVAMFSPPAAPVIGDLMAHTVSPLIGRAILPGATKAAFSPADVDERFAAVQFPLMLRPSQIHSTAADTALMIPAAMAMSARYDELNVPLTILAGEGDLITHIDKHAAKLAEATPGALLRRFDGVGHMLHYSLPNEVANAVHGMVQLIR